MSENGRELRLSAAQDVHAAIAAIRQATVGISKEDDPCRALIAIRKADDAVQVAKKSWSEADRNATQAWVYHRKIDDDDSRSWFSEVQGELDDATLMLRKARGARRVVIDKSLDTIDAFLNDRVINLNNTLFRKDDHCQALLKDWDEKRKAEREKREAVNPVVETNDVLNREDTEAEAASEELYDSDWFMWKVATSILDRTTSGREMLPWKTLEAEMRKTLNEQRAKYPTLNERLIVNWDHAKASLERLHRREMLICEFGGHAVWVKYDPQFIIEPEPGFPEEGKCLNDVGNPDCRIYTNKDRHGEYYTRCWSCNKIFQKRRDAKPVKPKPKPEPDDSGTLFETPEPEPAPVPVPASTAMRDAKPEADDLAELLRRGKTDEFLASAGHWHSTKFTRGLVLRAKADGATPFILQVFWAILTVLEGLDKDKTIIDYKSVMALAGVSASSVTTGRGWLKELNYITWDKNDNAYGIGPKVSDIIEDDTTDGKEHWHSTKYTLDVEAQLIADGVQLRSRIMFWAILTTLEGLGIESGKIQQRRIAETIGMGPHAPIAHVPALSELGWITHTPGSRDKGNSRAALATFGLGSRLTNQ